jgi:hypothetical protein
MSQSGTYVMSSGGPVAETLTGDIGGAVGPDGLFNINILGGSNITVTGNPLTNTLTIDQSGGFEGTGQTIGAVTADIITFPLGAVAGTHEFEIKVASFNAATPAGSGYHIQAAVRTTGAAGTLIGTPEVDAFEEAVLLGCSATVVVVGNNAIVRVLGVAGLTIDWGAELDFVFRG